MVVGNNDDEERINYKIDLVQILKNNPNLHSLSVDIKMILSYESYVELTSSNLRRLDIKFEDYPEQQIHIE